MPGVTRMSKANSRKAGNKKRQAKKAESYRIGAIRADSRRHKNDYKPGTKVAFGEPQTRIPVLLRGHGIDPRQLAPLNRGDTRPVSERVK